MNKLNDQIHYIWYNIVQKFLNENSSGEIQIS